MTLAVMVAAALNLEVSAQEKEKTKKEKQSKEATVDAATQAVDASASGAVPAAPAAIQTMKGLGAFGQLLPLGERNLDVKIPSFRNGVPSSMVRAGSMTKVDDQNMEIEKMDIRLYGETKDRDVRVQLATANYNMPTQVLSSEERSRISRQDFQLEGDEMIFDTNTQQGKISGRVEMIIFDTAGLMTATPPADAAAGDSPENNSEAKADAATPTATGGATPAPTATPSPNDK